MTIVESKLCTVFQGVQTLVEHPEGPIQAVVSREVLQADFGAEDDPASWLRTYRDHAPTIDQAIIAQCQALDAPHPRWLFWRDFTA